MRCLPMQATLDCWLFIPQKRLSKQSQLLTVGSSLGYMANVEPAATTDKMLNTVAKARASAITAKINIRAERDKHGNQI
jgi:hypothetical protein